jgi:hypothetical protein
VTGKELDSSCYDFIYVLNPYLSTEAEESHGSRFSAADDEVKNKKKAHPDESRLLLQEPIRRS